jgi:hypothetical protein
MKNIKSAYFDENDFLHRNGPVDKWNVPVELSIVYLK